MTFIDFLGIGSRWIHIVFVVIAIGGTVFMRCVLMPAARESLSLEVHDALREKLLGRWKRVVHVSIAVLVLTGSFNFYMTFHDGVKPIPYHPVFAVKLLLAFTIFFLASALVGSSPGLARFRSERRKWLSVQVVLAIVAILVSGVLKAIHQAAIAAGGS